MSLSLTPELEQLIHDKVKSGRYLSPSEVVAAGLRLLEERESLYQAKLAELQEKIDEGIAAGDRGEVVDGETVFAKLREKNRQRRAQLCQ